MSNDVKIRFHWQDFVCFDKDGRYMKYEKPEAEVIYFGNEEFMVASPGWFCDVYTQNGYSTCRGVSYVRDGYYWEEGQYFQCNDYGGLSLFGIFFCYHYA